MTDAVTPPNPAGGVSDGGDRRSKPDPTLLTIDALRREIAMLENLTDTRLNGAAALTAERFTAVHRLFAEAADRRREQKEDTAAAVHAALDAQKEALMSLRANFETSIHALQQSHADLKDRVTAQESAKAGQTEQRTESRQVSAGVIAALGVGVTALLAFMAVISFMVGAS